MPRTRRRKKLERSGRFKPAKQKRVPKEEGEYYETQRMYFHAKRDEIREKQCQLIRKTTGLLNDIIQRDIKPFLYSFPDLCVQAVGNPDYLLLGNFVFQLKMYIEQDFRFQCLICLRTDRQVAKPLKNLENDDIIYYPMCTDCLQTNVNAWIQSNTDGFLQDRVPFYQCRECHFCIFGTRKEAPVSKSAPYCLRYLTNHMSEEDRHMQLRHHFVLVACIPVDMQPFSKRCRIQPLLSIT